jgi:hypothetical protein
LSLSDINLKNKNTIENDDLNFELEIDGDIKNTNENICGNNNLNNELNFDLVIDLVETRRTLSLPNQPSESKTFGQQRYQNPGKNSVSSIIGSYKSAVTKHANRLGLAFGWQTRFHDHIIKNDAEFIRIANYIENNIANWNSDKFC